MTKHYQKCTINLLNYANGLHFVAIRYGNVLIEYAYVFHETVWHNQELDTWQKIFIINKALSTKQDADQRQHLWTIYSNKLQKCITRTTLHYQVQVKLNLKCYHWSTMDGP